MTLNRREFLASALPAGMPQRRPLNVLLFMTDQESALLPGPVALPARARLLERGVSFGSVFCNTPQCSAARSSMLTGLEPNRTGVLTNVDSTSLGKPLPPGLATVGSVFQAAGYATGYFGKWHLGDEENGPRRFGFATRESGKDGEVARQAAAWIRKQRDPWLAWVSVINPHNIYSLPKLLARVNPRPGVKPPASTLANLAGKPSEQRDYVDRDQGRATKSFTPEDWIRYRSYYCELIEKADACLGAVLDAVPDLKSTVAVYTSDHGDALGEHGLPFKGPFMYEEGIRVPLVVSAPGPVRLDGMLTSADVAPILADLAGVRWPAPASARRDEVHLEYYAKQKWVNPIRTIRTSHWKLSWYDQGNRELYDLANDPHELRNLAGAADVHAVQSELESKLNRWRKPLPG